MGKVDGYKVEILGLGQQCMVHGIHPDLGVVEWITPEGRSDDGLARVPRETLPLIKAVQIAEFLSRCRTIFGIGDDEPKTTDPEPWAPHGASAATTPTTMSPTSWPTSRLTRATMTGSLCCLPSIARPVAAPVAAISLTSTAARAQPTGTGPSTRNGVPFATVARCGTISAIFSTA